jgi:hypothetical protein
MTYILKWEYTNNNNIAFCPDSRASWGRLEMQSKRNKGRRNITERYFATPKHKTSEEKLKYYRL